VAFKGVMGASSPGKVTSKIDSVASGRRGSAHRPADPISLVGFVTFATPRKCRGVCGSGDASDESLAWP
jgi:hypothetical protein